MAPATENQITLGSGFQPSPTVASPSTWFSFWSRPVGVHVSDRHLRARYRVLADQFLAAFPNLTGKRLLDYGCGEALESRRLVRAGLEVSLYDRSAYFRDRIQQRYAGVPGLRVIDDEMLAQTPAGSLDFVLVSSVIQYLDDNEFAALLEFARYSLAPGGTLILADVIPRQLDLLSDLADFLSYSARHRFLLSGLRTLYDMVATSYREYWQQAHLARYDMDELAKLLRGYGFAAQPAKRNIGISRARKTMLATKLA